jgi:hypothetical protein
MLFPLLMPAIAGRMQPTQTLHMQPAPTKDKKTIKPTSEVLMIYPVKLVARINTRFDWFNGVMCMLTPRASRAGILGEREMPRLLSCTVP